LYFYADSNYQWVPKNAMTPFNDETKAMFKGQAVPRRHLADFKQAVQIADDEVQRDKEDRVSWHRRTAGSAYIEPSSSSSSSPTASPVCIPTEPNVPKKTGRFKRGKSNQRESPSPPPDGEVVAYELEKLVVLDHLGSATLQECEGLEQQLVSALQRVDSKKVRSM
jgi:hypothetical protein